MKPNNFSHISVITLIICLLLTSCARTPPQENPVVSDSEETVDRSCSYFYFLWGNNAEYNGLYDEALEAYQKAALCDPEANYVLEKIPILLVEMGKNDEAIQWLEDYLVEHPDSNAMRFMLARMKIIQGKDDEAITLYEELLRREPDNFGVQLRLGLIYAKKKDLETAEKIFRQVVEKSPDSYFAHLYLARLYSQEGMLEEAETSYNQALSLNWSKDLLFEMAEFYNISRQFNKARLIYRDILNQDETDERAALGLVQTELFLGDGQSALSELSKIIRFSSNPAKINLVRAQILINLGNLQEAKDILLGILKNEEIDQAEYLLGLIYYREMNYEQALSALRKIHGESYEYQGAVILQVRILEESLRSEEAVSFLKKALQDEETRQPIFYSLLASVLADQGKETQALDILEQGHSLYPEDETLLYEYAVQLEKKNRHDDAMTQMQKLIAINPNHADALNFVGYSWADSNIRLDEAEKYIEKALTLKPDSGYIIDSLGWLYFRQGKYSKALEQLKKAYQLEQKDPYLQEHLGDAYHMLGQDDKALEFYNKALEQANDSNQQQKLRNKIEQLKK